MNGKKKAISIDVQAPREGEGKERGGIDEGSRGGEEEMSEFPQWGFWIQGGFNENYNVTNTRHLFITDEHTACGYNPNTKHSYFRFSAIPKIFSLYEVLSQVERGRGFISEDFLKCKRCLRSEDKKK